MRLRISLIAAGVALVAAPAAACLAPAAALADQPVVTAVVFPGGQGAQHTVTVTDAELASGCPSYAAPGSAPFTLQPSGQPFQPATGSAWSLDTVVECGLHVPRSAVTAVSVQATGPRSESPLSARDLYDSGQYHDPGAPAALPVVSLDGGSGQVTYARPLRGPSDPNAADRVVDSGPLTIDVFENAPPLSVQIVRSALRSAPHTVRDRFTAQVSDQSGQIVPASSLRAAWSFGDGHGSNAAQPEHTFTTAGRYFVTVTVSDPASGTGGTRTVAVSVDGAALSGNHDRAGAGTHRKPSSNSGSVHGTGSASQGATVTNPAAPPASTATAPIAPTPSPAPSAPTTTTSTAATTSAASRAVTQRRGRPRRSRSRSRSRARHVTAPVPASTRLVSGQLVASLHPIAARSSPLADPAASPPAVAAVGAAVHTSSPAGWIAALAVAALLVLGAARERRGHARWRRLHPPA